MCAKYAGVLLSHVTPSSYSMEYVGSYIRFRTPYELGLRFSTEEWTQVLILSLFVQQTNVTEYTTLGLDGPFISHLSYCRLRRDRSDTKSDGLHPFSDGGWYIAPLARRFTVTSY